MDDLPAGSVFVPEDAPVYDMPVSAINRPLMSALDECKLQQFMDDMQVRASSAASLLVEGAAAACGKASLACSIRPAVHPIWPAAQLVPVTYAGCSACTHTLVAAWGGKHKCEQGSPC
eukprot:GHRR01012383.1.p1 GENE.GHRR01012383.1~~GHRR01012383.1.p1  ORF type:complete len:118 (+),score=34.10 GHRR01012383.1:153-506(+)